MPLRIIAFSDWRVQNIEHLIGYIQELSEKPDVILYAGDNISRFNNSVNYFEKLAMLSKYGLGAVAGNEDYPLDIQIIRGNKVYNLHNVPLLIRDYVVIGVEGAILPSNVPKPSMTNIIHSEEYIREHLNEFLRRIPENKKLILVSHTPPHSILDLGIRFGLRHIGSTAVKDFIEKHSNRLDLVICGHVHSQGGKTEEYHGVHIVNCASHDDPGAPGNVAIIEIGENVQINWVKIDDKIGESEKIKELMKVPHVGQNRANKLLKYGVDSIEKLASLPYDHPLSKNPTFMGAFELVVNYAKAISLNKPIVVGKHPFFKHVDDKNIYFFDTEYVPKREIFLIGWMDRNGKISQLFLDNPREEGTLLADFYEWIINEKPVLISYSSKSADLPQLKRAFERYGLPTRELKRAFFDLYYDCINTFTPKKQYIFLPLPDATRLEDVSRYFGYPRKDLEILDGAMALNKYSQFLETKDRAIKEELLEYNAEDLNRLRFTFEKIKELMEQVALKGSK